MVEYSPMLSSLLFSSLYITQLRAMWGKNHLGVLHHSIASRPADRLVLIAEGYLNICKEKVEPFRFILIFIHLILIVRSDWAQNSTLFHIDGFRMIRLY